MDVCFLQGLAMKTSADETANLQKVNVVSVKKAESVQVAKNETATTSKIDNNLIFSIGSRSSYSHENHIRRKGDCDTQSKHPSTYQKQLEMLALSVNAVSAFMYELSTGHVYHYGDNAYLTNAHYAEFRLALTQYPSTLKVLNAKSLSIALPTSTHILTMLLTHSGGEALAIIGTPVVANPSVKLTKNQRTLATLIMQNLEAELRQRQQANTLHAIHSQHLQISALNQDHICIKDSAHKMVYANPAMLATFPKSNQNELLGKSIAHYYEPNTSAQIVDSDVSALTTGYYKGNEQLILPNGEEKILLTTKKSFIGVDGKKYLMSVSRDVTEKEILINDLKRSNSDLDNFAYVASHDLRSPLNVIKRLVSWVKEDCNVVLPSESNEDLAIVLSRVERMEKLLIDLLSYSRIGKDYQEAITINLHDFMVELLSLIDLPMGFVLKCDNIDIVVPEIAFNVVMLNLVSNAIKHHDSGNAKIEVKAKRNDKGWVITVVDNGPGIEAKNRDRIFKLFETLRPRDEIEGSGMGLSVVKKIVQHYGGSIEVDANLPRGTKFIVAWPLHNIARTVLGNLND
jgi:signal transduction histidine kinase